MMNNEKEKDAIDTSKLDEILPKYDPLKLNSINLAQNYVSAFNTGMNIYQCVNQLQGYIEWVVKAVNDVVKSWNVQVGESIDQSKAIVRETTTEQFNNEKSVFNDELDALNARMNTFSNPNLLINPDFKINQRGSSTYTTTSESPIYTVDRWMLSSGKATVNSDGTVTVTATDVTTNKEGYFQQKLENAISGAYTVSMEVVSISGTVGIAIDGEWKTVTSGKNVFQGVNSSNNFNSVGLHLAVGASITLKYMKLEQGKVATSFVAPNPAEELVKCERFLLFTPSSMVGYRFDSYIYVYLEKLKNMRTNGTCSVRGINNDISLLSNGDAQNGLSFGSEISVSKDKQFIRIDVKNISTSFKTKVLGIDINKTDIIIDSEIY